MNIVFLIKDYLQKATSRLGFSLIDFKVETSSNKRFGDYTSNIALKLTSKKKTIGSDSLKKPSEKAENQQLKIQQSPIEIAKRLVFELNNDLKISGYFEKIEVTEPGFINFHLSKQYLQAEVARILDLRRSYAKNNLGDGKKASVEFVSANPTGPLHVGNARGGPLGDAICNILIYSGYSVDKEFYVNDEGGQIAKFGKTLLWLSLGSEFVSKKLKESKISNKEDELEYKGKYMNDLASKTKKDILKKYSLEELSEMTIDELSVLFGKNGAKIQVQEIIADLEMIGIDYDKLYFESFFSANKTPKIINLLEKNGFVFEKEGAKWFVANRKIANMDLDRESVLVKSNGELTYFANDIAYHDEKFKIKPAIVINVLGSGHHGHLSRITAAIAALGYDPRQYKVVLYQNVALKESGKVVKMSKREGNFVTASEVIKAVGKDAFRFFMLMHESGTHLDFDLELARKKSSENPVYYVQYAHARIESILRKAKNEKVKEKNGEVIITDPFERALIIGLIKLPVLVENIAYNFSVHQLTYYAIEVADLFHRFYENCKVISDDSKLTTSRLQLTVATGIILRTTLDILGVSAPKRM